MNDEIELQGVSTNNLKSIDVKFIKNQITAVTGVSGGGKSSLAYNSLYEKCRQEFRSIESGHYESINYNIKISKNIIPAVALKQKNSNINPRSTIYSYLNLSSLISSLILDDGILINSDQLKINKPENQCRQCEGMGEIHTACLEKAIDANTKIKNNPFLNWHSSVSNKKHKLLLAYCLAENISLESLFCDLTKTQRDKLINDESSDSYEISFKHSGKNRKRSLNFIGAIKEINENLISGSDSVKKSALKYCKSVVCSHCKGSKVNILIYSTMSICGVSFERFLSEPIESVMNDLGKSSYCPKQLYEIFNDIVQVGLGYLSLSRSIPTLSGGELQKLNFSKLCNSEITGILVIIDEISSQVHASDYSMLINRIKRIKNRRNTIVLVEHNELFIKSSDYAIEIGPEPGESGGYVIENYNIRLKNHLKIKAAESKYKADFFTIKNINKNNVKNLNLNLPKKSISVLVGKSGSGKSSIAKYINENNDNSVYISQDLIKGNIRSTVATLTGINKKISRIFGNHFKIDQTTFSVNEHSHLICKKCSGKGLIRISRSFESDVETTCPTCDGKLFSEKAEEFKIDGFSIKDLYDLSFDAIYQLKIKELQSTLSHAIRLGLGHLSLNRKSQTLSGGELKRVKILIKLPIRNCSDKILIIDEPGSGLDDKTATSVMKFISSFKENYKSIIIIDHKPSVFLSADFIIEIGPESGSGGGKIIYSGSPRKYYNEKYLDYISDLL